MTVINKIVGEALPKITKKFGTTVDVNTEKLSQTFNDVIGKLALAKGELGEKGVFVTAAPENAAQNEPIPGTQSTIQTLI
ncbi:MAG: hypothetical protein KKB81_07135 [Candidatus Margulisbacteria bacterium]|nr:hypothetical protein [Candidatus Margulisiibacteriota bacterium]MBU1021917.1 hypothetical protein [Candidatus Margulisiibacteriota bacterium]MBU1728555.1 hypothetical protein [Candidatus Margulisiibacteriota bacterium]MBU1954702.1 hypothetical protein [Candidatus Margulisiibacteriota bacterium]